MELILLAQVVAAVAVYFLFIRVKTDPRVKELADLAFKAAAQIAELRAMGSTPPVNLKDGAWETRGTNVVGNYKWVGAFGKVFWDRILVIDDPSRIWVILVHEMMHAVRRRNGKPSSEAAAYSSKPKAIEFAMATPQVAALLRRL